MPSFTSRDGVRLHYADSGSGDPPLLLVHGWCGRLGHWEPQARAFQRRHRVVRPDLRGHGRSAAPPEATYARSDFVADLAALAQELRLRDAVVVGHSMAVPIVLDLAVAVPELARAIVLVDGGWREAVPAAELDAHPWLAPLLRKDDVIRQIRKVLGWNIGPHATPSLRERILDESALTRPQVAVAAMRNTILGTGVNPAWSQLTQPILYIGASRSAAARRTVRATLPQAQYAQAVGCGHWVQLEVPDQFNAMLRRFIETL